MLPVDLLEKWREKARDYHEHALDPVARAYERCADQLEEALDSEHNEALTLQEAAEESGYSADHLGRLVRDGKIPNAGRPGAPRIKRGDLPLKPESRDLPLADDRPKGHRTGRQVVQSIIEEGAA